MRFCISAESLTPSLEFCLLLRQLPIRGLFGFCQRVRPLDSGFRLRRDSNLPIPLARRSEASAALQHLQ